MSGLRKLTDQEQKKAAKEFAERWKNRGDEKQDDQSFWNELLHEVLGVERPTEFIDYQKRVKFENSTKFADGYIKETKILIEQKGLNINLAKGELQSDGVYLRPDQQARRYANNLPYNEKPKYIIVSNFKEIWIYDENRPHSDPEKILLKDLPKEYYRLAFMVDTGNVHIKKEMELSIKAGEIVGEFYSALHAEYHNPEDPESLKSLNKLCVRLVFCLYAEDAGLFGKRSAFHDYLNHFEACDCRQAIRRLFKVLNQKPEERDPYLEPELAAFPYVNGGLFDGDDLEIPQFTDEIRNLILSRASDDFDWSEISPTIFGAVFESTLNPETRRKGGMHYTSIENIHKVIDPLFYDELCAEFEKIKNIKTTKTRNAELETFRDKLASLTFLDPACGSGNFLTETYLSLRRLENEAIQLMQDGKTAFGFLNPIKVQISQFYGIEINDFAVTVAKTALWIAESQMMQETERIMSQNLDFLPLKTYTNIAEGNALRTDWNSIIPAENLNYIMGNPPFVGYSLQSKSQKQDILDIYVDEKGKPYKTAGKIDYVAGWYFKASEMMQNTKIRTAFVSTNSITQGEQVAGVWKPLYDRFGVHIDFAHRTFRWDNEASLKAHVHCVIAGFSIAKNPRKRIIFETGRKQKVDNINAYLINGDNVFVESRNKPICDIPEMTTGNRPADGGHLIIEAEDYDDFIKKEPNAKKYIKKLIGADEFINGTKRYCLWLMGVSPAELRQMPLVLERIEACRKARLDGAPDRQKLADTPTLFRETLNPTSAIVVPVVSSERRRYVPMDYIGNDIICTDRVKLIPEAKLYHFGILQSNINMAWMRTVCGRLESRYNYSKDIVYNNFPWPSPTARQKEKIEQAAQGILDARAKYPDASLADLYDETTMPPELRKAHQLNDRAVMEAYGFDLKTTTESTCVAELMEMYQKLIGEKNDR